MLESVLASVLNKFLSQYVDNLSTKDLNIGIWSGDIKLRNLRLKKEALDKFRLPVDVVEGYLGDLTLSIPWYVLLSFALSHILLYSEATDGTLCSSGKTTAAED